MAKLAIATPALSDAATLYAGSQVASLPAANLQSPALTEKWRTNGNLSLEVDLGAARPVNLVALLGTNALSTTQYRVRAADTQAALIASPGYDAGTLSHWPQANLGDWAETHLIHWLATARSYRWWRIDLTDAALPYYQAGRLYIASAWQPAVNVSWGAEQAWVNPSTATRSLGGQVWIDARPAYRRQRLVLEWLTEAEAYAGLAPLQRLRAGRKDVLVLPDPEGPHLQERSVYGRLLDNRRLVRRRQGVAAEIVVEELL